MERKRLSEAAGGQVEAKLGERDGSAFYRLRRDGDVYALQVQTADGKPSKARRFRREVATLARLNHPCLPRVRAAGTVEGRPFFVTDIVDGPPLAEHLDNGPVAERVAVRIGMDVARGLSVLHRADLVHRDVTPWNILWDGHRARLVDFGMVTPRGQTSERGSVRTVAYAAPEQTGLLERPIDGRTDLYALGATLYRAVAGRPPYRVDDVETLARRQATGDVEALEALVDGISEPFASVVGQLLATEPDERIADADTLWSRLADCLADGDDRPRAAPSEVSAGSTADAVLSARARQTDRLFRQWELIRSTGYGGLTVLDGEAGMGKASIREAVARHVVDRGGCALTGSCSPREPAPYAVVRELATSRNEVETGLAGAGRMDGGGAEATYIRKLARGEVESPVPEDVDLAGVCARWLGRLARDAEGMLIAISDAQWIDEPSLDVLRRLVLMLDRYPIHLIVDLDSSKSGGVGRRFWTAAGHLEGMESAAVAADPPEVGRRIRLELTPLSRFQTERFVEGFLGEPIEAPELVDHLRSATGGQPFLLEEWLSKLLDAFILRPWWDGWELDREKLDEVEWSDDARTLQARRIEAVDPETRRLAALAAAWGPVFATDLIAEAAGLEPGELEARLEAARDNGLIIEDDRERTDRRHYRFTHESIRQILRSDFDDDVLAEFHQRLAEAADRDEDRSDYVAARHFARGDGSNPERTYAVCRRAGRRALEEGAFGDVIAFLETARRAAERLGRPIPPEIDYRLGCAYLQRERVDDGRTALRRAMERFDDPTERAACQRQLNDLAVARMNIGELEAGVRRVLDLLDRRPPAGSLESSIGIVRGAVSFASRHLSSEAPGEEQQRRRDRLLARAFDELTVVAIFNERPLLTAYALLGLMNAADRLGPSYELVLAHSSMAMVWALDGRKSLAEASLERARQTAEETESARARVRLDVAAGWIAQAQGHSRKAAERLSDILVERGEQLSLTERRRSYGVLSWNLAARGHSIEVLEWFDYWRSVIDLEPDDVHPPSPIYASVVVQARLCGRDELADDLREASRRTIEVSDSIYLKRRHWGAVVGDLVVGGGGPDEIGEAIERRRALGAEPGREVFWSRLFYVYQAYGRWRQCRVAEAEPRESGLQAFRAAVDDLFEAAGEHPTLRSHAHVNRARLALFEGDEETAGRHLDTAERLARRTDNRWVTCNVARVRSEHLDERQLEPERRSYAHRAVEVAERNGWLPHAEHLRQLFGLIDREPVSASEAGAESVREAELERQLDGLLEVTAATESVLEPAELQRVALDAAIDALGAERGLLFLRDDEGAFELRTARSADGDDLADDAPFNETIVGRVAESGEPTVMTAAMASHSRIRSAIATSMQIDDEFVGILYLDSRVARGLFGETDLEVLRAIGSQIGVAIANARAAQLEVEVATERRRRAYAEHLRTFTEEVTAMLDVADILERLVEQLREVVAFDSAAVVRIDTGVRVELLIRGDTTRGRPFDADRRAQLVDDPELTSLLEEGQMRFVERLVGPHQGPELLGEETSSWLGLPVGAQDELFGAVLVGSDRPHDFDAADVEEALAYASQAGIAIAKARLATIDPLTGVYNRRKLFELAEREFARADRYPTSLSVLMLDIDDFKRINDTHGHAVGDRVLERVASICQSSLRKSDIVGRYGGEEFAAVLPASERREAATAVAERLRSAIEEASIAVEGETLSVTASIGVAERAERDAEVQEVFERADEALYEAKSEGKDRVATAS